jgi:hypothetical protein
MRNQYDQDGRRRAGAKPVTWLRTGAVAAAVGMAMIVGQGVASADVGGFSAHDNPRVRQASTAHAQAAVQAGQAALAVQAQSKAALQQTVAEAAQVKERSDAQAKVLAPGVVKAAQAALPILQANDYRGSAEWLSQSW